MVGTMAYMAPEVLSGNAGKPADVWGLGMAVLEMCVGRRQWTHLSTTIPPAALMYQIMQGMKHPIPASFPPSLQSFLEQALACNLEERMSCSVLLTHPFILSKELYNPFIYEPEPEEEKEPLMQNASVMNRDPPTAALADPSFSMEKEEAHMHAVISYIQELLHWCHNPDEAKIPSELLSCTCAHSVVKGIFVAINRLHTTVVSTMNDMETVALEPPRRSPLQQPHPSPHLTPNNPCLIAEVEGPQIFYRK